MLVLSRKLGEKIVIGDNIVVTVVKIDRNQIRIGIEAPSEIPVYREEIAPQRLTSTAERSDAVLVSRVTWRTRAAAHRSQRRRVQRFAVIG